MNKVNLIGRLTKDPELRFTPGTGTAITNITLAVDRKMPNKDGKREADFINIVIWNKPAETIANYCIKGKLLAISGRIQVRSYEAKDGSKRYVTEVVAEDYQILEWASKSKGDTQNNSNSQENNQFEDMTPVDDGDIPF